MCTDCPRIALPSNFYFVQWYFQIRIRSGANEILWCGQFSGNPANTLETIIVKTYTKRECQNKEKQNHGGGLLQLKASIPALRIKWHFWHLDTTAPFRKRVICCFWEIQVAQQSCICCTQEVDNFVGWAPWMCPSELNDFTWSQNSKINLASDWGSSHLAMGIPQWTPGGKVEKTINNTHQVILHFIHLLGFV